MYRWKMLGALALIAGLAMPVSAQQHQHRSPADRSPEQSMGAMQGMSGMMSNMALLRSLQPAALLRASELLELTSGQVEQLEALAQEAEAAHGMHMHASMAAHGRAATALADESDDREALANAVTEAATHMGAAHVATANAAMDARAVLTAEQQSKLEAATSWMSTMRMMAGMDGQMCADMMGQGGMHQGPGNPQSHQH